MKADHPEYTDYIGKVHWTVAFAIPAVILAVCVIAILGQVDFNNNGSMSQPVRVK